MIWGEIIAIAHLGPGNENALDADIKSLKKAARQNVGPEIIRRIQQIIDTGLIELKDDFKIYWNNDPIAKLPAGSDYLNPKIELIIEIPYQQITEYFAVKKWIVNIKIHK